jgi:hypothetical protein
MGDPSRGTGKRYRTSNAGPPVAWAWLAARDEGFYYEDPMLTGDGGGKAVLYFTSVANAGRFVAKRGGDIPDECRLYAMDRERFAEWLANASRCGAHYVIADPDPPSYSPARKIFHVLAEMD